MITSAENLRWEGDIEITDLRSAGLPAASLVRPAKIAVVDAARVARRLGRIEKRLRAAVAAALHAQIAKP
jgi:mRNA interferase MazF